MVGTHPEVTPVSTGLSADPRVALRLAIEANIVAIAAMTDEIRDHPSDHIDEALSQIDADLQRIAETLRSALNALDAHQPQSDVGHTAPPAPGVI